MTTQEYQKDLVIFRNEETRLFRLRYPNPLTVASAIQALYGDRVRFSVAQSGDIFSGFGGVDGFGGALGGPGGGFRGLQGKRSPAGWPALGVALAAFPDRGFGFLPSAAGFGAFGGFQSRKEREQTLKQELTPDQIAALEQAKELKEGQVVEAKALEKIGAGKKQDIFVVVVPDHNLVVVRSGDPEALGRIAELVERLDQPTPQVLLEMKILRLTLGDGQGGVTSFPIDTVDTANLFATVVAKDGLTVAVGGMIHTTVSADRQKVPLLGTSRIWACCSAARCTTSKRPNWYCSSPPTSFPSRNPARSASR